jgi:hypothetical protein
MYKPANPLTVDFNEGIRKNVLCMPSLLPRRKDPED